MKVFFVIAIALTLAACAMGPDYIAKNESESMKTYYDDPELQRLHSTNRALLQEIYYRFTKNKVNFQQQGIGVTTMKDLGGKPRAYLMVYLRPSDVNFDENTTKPGDRISDVVGKAIPKYLEYVRKEDVSSKGIDGIAFGIFYGVRDFSQCDKYGGFLEYAIVFIPKEDIANLKNGYKTAAEVIEGAEVLASVEKKPAQSIRPVFKQ